VPAGSRIQEISWKVPVESQELCQLWGLQDRAGSRQGQGKFQELCQLWVLQDRAGSRLELCWWAVVGRGLGGQEGLQEID